MSEDNTKEDKKQLFSARLPRLVDIVENRETLHFMLREKGELYIHPSVEIGKSKYVPPPRDQLTWQSFGMPSSTGVIRAFHKPEDPEYLFRDIRAFLQPLFALPKPEYYDFLALYVMLTYLTDHPDVRFLGIIYLLGDRERGKGRLLEGMAHVVYRANLTETLNVATLFRFSDYVGGTLLLDVSDFWRQAARKGAEDFMINRFEQGRLVHRVKSPDAGAFNDMAHYEVFGPTLISTNSPIPSVLHSRCFPISMPLKAGIYKHADQTAGLGLRERLLAFRARMLDVPLPESIEVGSGRWQDICGPLTRIAQLISDQAPDDLNVCLVDMENVRNEQQLDSVETQIVRCVIELESEVSGGKLETKLIRNSINEDVPERYHIAPQTFGRVLSTLGFRKTKNRQFVYWDTALVEALKRQHGL